MQKKYQIFVSSTFRDLADERQDAIRSILDLGHIPAGMELFPAADTEQLEYIKKVIDECDYYVLIMGGRYGSLDNDGVSYTEREYDYAVETGKIVLAFVHGDANAIPVGKADTAPRLVKNLNEFREKVMGGRLVREWTSREKLEPMVLKAIVHATSTLPAVGWVRGNAVANEEILSQINALRVENNELKTENKNLRVALVPKIDGLAALDEQVTIRYTYSYYHRNSSERRNGEMIMTWQEILKAVGPGLMKPVQPSQIGSFLDTHFKENRGRGTSYSSILDSDVALVKNQLIALGYVRSYNTKAMNAGITEFVELTESGRTKVTELLAVRSSTK